MSVSKERNWIGRVRAEADGTRAETTFRLSPERTSPFKSARESVQSTAGSRGVHISVSNAGYSTFRGRVRVLATHSIRQFRLHFPSRVPPHSERSITQKTSLPKAIYRSALNGLCSGAREQLLYTTPPHSCAPQTPLWYLKIHHQQLSGGTRLLFTLLWKNGIWARAKRSPQNRGI